jgi:hypothetical protein
MCGLVLSTSSPDDHTTETALARILSLGSIATINPHLSMQLSAAYLTKSPIFIPII